MVGLGWGVAAKMDGAGVAWTLGAAEAVGATVGVGAGVGVATGAATTDRLALALLPASV
jgi:hypothetical protein